MARLPTPGSDSGTWGAILNGYLVVAHNNNGTLKTSALRSAGAVTSVNGKSPVNGSVTLAATDIGALSTAATLDNISDVNASTPSDNQVLAFDSASNKWVAATVTGGGTVSDATTSSKGIVELTGDLGGTAASPTVTATHLSSALPVNQGGTGSITQNFVDLSTTQTVTGAKTFGTVNLSALKVTGGTPGTGKVLASDTSGNATWTTPAAGVQLDTTASDIQPLGIRSAGSTNKAADAGHVHAMPVAAEVGALADTDDLSAIATANATAGNVSMNSHKLTNLANGAVSTDAVTLGQLPTALPPNGTAGGDLSNTYPNPTVTATHLSAALPVNQGGTGSETQNFVDLTTTQSVGGVKTFTSAPVVPNGAFPESAVASLTTDLAATEKTANKNVANGYAPLDSNSLVPVANLPYNITVSDSAPSSPQDGDIWFDTST